MQVNIKQAIRLFFSNPSLDMVFIEAIANSLDADASKINISLNPQLHSRSATYIKRNGLLIRKITIKSSRPFQCAYHPLTP